MGDEAVPREVYGAERAVEHVAQRALAALAGGGRESGISGTRDHSWLAFTLKNSKTITTLNALVCVVQKPHTIVALLSEAPSSRGVEPFSAYRALSGAMVYSSAVFWQLCESCGRSEGSDIQILAWLLIGKAFHGVSDGGREESLLVGTEETALPVDCGGRISVELLHSDQRVCLKELCEFHGGDGVGACVRRDAKTVGEVCEDGVGVGGDNDCVGGFLGGGVGATVLSEH